jgi:hypothetical protein
MELFCTEGDNMVPYLSSNTLMSSPALKVNSLSSAASKSQWLATDLWFSHGTPVSSPNKTESWYSWNVESGVKHHKPNPLWGQPLLLWKSGLIGGVTSLEGD